MSGDLSAIARAYAARIVAGDVSPGDGARAICEDVFHHLEVGDHSVDSFVYWAEALEHAQSERHLVYCQLAIVRHAGDFLRGHPGN